MLGDNKSPPEKSSLIKGGKIMKKIISVILIFALAVIGCSCAAKSGVDNDAVSGQEDNHIVPPKILDFYSIEETKEFIQSVNLPDEDFDNFIKKNSYNMNGVDSKADVIKYCDILKDIPIITGEGVNLESMLYYVDYGKIDMRYEAKDGNSFDISCDVASKENTQNELREWCMKNDMQNVSVNTDKIGNVMKMNLEDDGTDWFKSIYVFTMNGYCIRFRGKAEPDKALEFLEKAGFETFEEYYR